MLEAVIILILSTCILFLVRRIFKLQQKINKYEFDIFMQNVEKELTSNTREDYTVVERILQ